MVLLYRLTLAIVFVVLMAFAASAQPQSAALIQQALRTLLASAQTVSAAWTFSTGVIAATLTGSGTAPTVDDTTGGTSCGTSGNPSMVANSTNLAGSFNVGAGGGTDCTLTFSVAAAHKWNCAVSNTTTANLARAVPATTTTTKFVGTFAAADVIAYACIAY